MTVSPEAPRIPLRASVESATALDEIAQRLVQILEFCSVPQRPRPFAPRPVIGLVMISRAKDHRCKRFRPSNRVVPSQVQCSMSTVDCPILLRP